MDMCLWMFSWEYVFRRTTIQKWSWLFSFFICSKMLFHSWIKFWRVYLHKNKGCLRSQVSVAKWCQPTNYISHYCPNNSFLCWEVIVLHLENRKHEKINDIIHKKTENKSENINSLKMPIFIGLSIKLYIWII